MKKIEFSEEEITRYQRHLLLPEIGGAGQQKLKKAKILVVGAGGLASPLLLYLSAAGIGEIGLIDQDVVTLSNLQRQILYDTHDLFEKKVLSAKKKIQALNPHVKVNIYEYFLNCENIEQILSGYDLVIDSLDNFTTRYLLADYAEKLQKPLISGAISSFQGSVTVFVPYLKDNPSYRDLFPHSPPEGQTLPCALAGVIGPLPGIIGSLQAMEALKIILNIGQPLIGRLLVYDALLANCKIYHYKSAKNRSEP